MTTEELIVCRLGAALEKLVKLRDENARLRHVIAGHEKAAALMNAGMESQGSLMDAMKQKLREAQAEVARLRAEWPEAVDRLPKGGEL
jgi:peptidoglycan hydrolase CwlO-like protein